MEVYIRSAYLMARRLARFLNEVNDCNIKFPPKKFAPLASESDIFFTHCTKVAFDGLGIIAGITTREKDVDFDDYENRFFALKNRYDDILSIIHSDEKIWEQFLKLVEDDEDPEDLLLSLAKPIAKS